MIRILVADDNPQALRLAEQILSSQGLEVVSASDGEIALQRLVDVRPDLLITDVYLPSKNAFEMARFMRADARYREIPIIFAASPADEFDEQVAKNAGADVILRKPFEASSLLSTVHQLLEQVSTSRGGEESASSSPDRNSIRAAVTIALDSAMPALIEELTQRVMLALSSGR